MTARALALLLVAAVAAASCGAGAGCAPLAGGEPDAFAQLRWLRFGDDQVSLLFGLRADAPFGVPAHTAAAAGGRVEVRIPNARLRYPDGTPSYLGERVLDPPPGRLGAITVAEDGEGVVVSFAAAGCPRLASRRYGLGSTHAAALVSIALRDGPIVALDPDHGGPGLPMQVIGMGFAPSSPVALHTAGRLVWTSASDAAGRLDTVLRVPEGATGRESVLVRDLRGGALTWYRVDEP